MPSKRATARVESVGRVGQRRQVVIPQALFKQLHMQEGDFVAFSIKENAVIMKPKKIVDPEDVLSPAEAKKIRLALGQVKSGKTKPWADIKHDLGL